MMAGFRSLSGVGVAFRLQGSRLISCKGRALHTAPIVKSKGGPKDTDERDLRERGAYHEIHKREGTSSPATPQQGQAKNMDRVVNKMRPPRPSPRAQDFPATAQRRPEESGERSAALEYGLQSRMRKQAPATLPLEDLVTSKKLGEMSNGDAEKFASVAGTKLAWPAGVQKQFKMLKEEVIMVRKPAVRLGNVLAGVKDSPVAETMPVIFVHGGRGTGKSTMLAHAAQACLEKGWIVFQVPSALHLTCTPARVMPSTWRQGMYDQPFNAADLLLGFKNMNEQQLSQIKLTGEYQFEKLTLGTNNTLLELVNAGAGPFDPDLLLKPPVSSDVLRAVLDELRKVKSAPVLLTIDAFNSFFNVSEQHSIDDTRLHALQLSMTHLFTSFFESRLARGALLLGLSETGVTSYQKYSIEIRKFLSLARPLDLGAEGSDPSIDEAGLYKYRTNRMEHSELRAFLSYYRQKGLLSRDVEPSVVDEINCMASGMMEQVVKLAAVA